MMDKFGDETIGVVGLGKLGMALATRLAKSFPVLAYDIDRVRSDLVPVDPKLEICGLEDLLARSDVVLLCVPPEAVVPALAALKGKTREDGLVVNLATAMNAPMTCGSSDFPRAINLKMIGQFKAVESGIRSIFVMDGGDARHHKRLARILDGIGQIRFGDQDMVSRINEVATREALLAAGRIKSAFSGSVMPPEFIEAAIKNVFVGTGLDYPPDPGNAYIRGILAGMSEAWSTRIHDGSAA
jgi:hypothetical protein